MHVVSDLFVHDIVCMEIGRFQVDLVVWEIRELLSVFSVQEVESFLSLVICEKADAPAVVGHCTDGFLQ